MVQKKWTGLSLIVTALLFSGCYKIFASPASLKAVEREVEAVEEELGDATQKVQLRRKSLGKQLTEIKSADTERKLFFSVLKKQTAMLMDDMVQLFDDMARVSTQLKQTDAAATSERRRLKKYKSEAAATWAKRRESVRGAIRSIKKEHTWCKGTK